MKKTFRFFVMCLAVIQLLVASGCSEENIPQQEPLTFTVDVTSVSSSSITATVSPSSDQESWYASVVTKEVFQSYGDDVSFATAMKADLIHRIESGEDKAELVRKGKKTVEFTGLAEKTEYIVFVFGVDDDMNLISDLATKESVTVADETFFTVDISGVASARMEVKVTPKDPEMTYNFSVSEQRFVDSFENDDEYLAEYKQYLLLKYGSYEPALSKGETYWEATDLNPETTYYVVLFGMNTSGDVTTPIFKFPFTTEPVAMVDMELKVDMDLVHNTLNFTVTPSKDDCYYFYSFVKKADVGEFTNEELFKKCFDEATADLKVPGLGYTYEEIMKEVGKVGKHSDSKTLLAETDWVMLIGGINSDLHVNTEVSAYDFYTNEAHLDYTIKGKATNVTPISAVIEVSFSGPMWYYYKLFPKEYVDGFSSDEELVDALEFTSEGGLYPFYELSFVKNEKGLKPDTEYCAVVVGYNQGPATPPAKIYFTTPEEGDPSGVTVDISVVPFAESAETTFMPSDNNVLYAYDNISKEAWEQALASNGNDPDDAVKELFDNKVQEYMDYGSKEDAVAAFSNTGKSIYKFLWLEQQSEYVIWAVSLDSELNPAGKCQIVEYSTGVQGKSDVKAVFKNVRYFQMDELREEFPEASWWEGNSPVIVYEIEADEDAFHVYSSMWYWGEMDDVTDEEIFEEIFPYDEGKDVMITSVVGVWDYTDEFVAFAVDRNGNYGPIDRLKVTPSIEESSPASEFPEELLAGLNSATKPVSHMPRAEAKTPSPVIDLPVAEVVPALREKASDMDGIMNVKRIK